MPAEAVPPGAPLGGEKIEASGKFRLKPILRRDPSKSPPPGLAGINPLQAPMRPSAAILPPAGIPDFKAVPAPRSEEISPRPKPRHGALLGALLALLVLCLGGYFWFFARGSKSAAASKPPSSSARPQPPLVAKAAPDAHGPAAAEHPAPVSGLPATGTSGAPAARSADAPGASSSSVPVASAPPPPVPTLLFRTFVDRLKISGVRTGPPARLFVDGVAYHPGDIVDRSLGLVFVGVDAATSEIVFKDSTGAVVRRRF